MHASGDSVQSRFITEVRAKRENSEWMWRDCLERSAQKGWKGGSDQDHKQAEIG